MSLPTLSLIFMFLPSIFIFLFNFHSSYLIIFTINIFKIYYRKRISAEQPIKPYVPKKIEEVLLPHHDDLTPGGETPGHTNGSNIFYSHFNNYSAHFKNGKTATNNHSNLIFFYFFLSFHFPSFNFSKFTHN